MSWTISQHFLRKNVLSDDLILNKDRMGHFQLSVPSMFMWNISSLRTRLFRRRCFYTNVAQKKHGPLSSSDQNKAKLLQNWSFTVSQSTFQLTFNLNMLTQNLGHHSNKRLHSQLPYQLVQKHKSNHFPQLLQCSSMLEHQKNACKN